jgi:hypothetical protein
MSELQILKDYISTNIDSLVFLCEKRKQKKQIIEEYTQNISEQCSKFLTSFHNNYNIIVYRSPQQWLLKDSDDKTVLAQIDLNLGFSKDKIFIDYSFPSAEDKRKHMSSPLKKDIESFKKNFIVHLVNNYPERFI